MELLIRRFNYQHFYISSQQDLSKNGAFQACIDGVPFDLNYVTRNDEDEYTFGIENLAVLMKDTALETLLQKWRNKRGGVR